MRNVDFSWNKQAKNYFFVAHSVIYLLKIGPRAKKSGHPCARYSKKVFSIPNCKTNVKRYFTVQILFIYIIGCARNPRNDINGFFFSPAKIWHDFKVHFYCPNVLYDKLCSHIFTSNCLVFQGKYDYSTSYDSFVKSL